MREYYDKAPTTLSKIPDNAFTKNLKDLMEERKLTDTQLADAIGVSRMTVGRYKAGTNFPEAGVLCAIAKFFGVTADFLLGLDTNRKNSAITVGRAILAIDMLRAFSDVSAYKFKDPSNKECHDEAIVVTISNKDVLDYYMTFLDLRRLIAARDARGADTTKMALKAMEQIDSLRISKQDIKIDLTKEEKALAKIIDLIDQALDENRVSVEQISQCS